MSPAWRDLPRSLVNPLSSSELSDHFDLNQSAERKLCDLDRGAGWLVSFEAGFIECVHFGEVTHILKEHGSFNDILHFKTHAAEETFYVSKNLSGLTFHVRGLNFAGSWIDRNLAGTEKEIARANRLGVGADGGWSFGCRDDFHDIE